MSRTSSEVRRASRTARRRGVIAAIGIVVVLGLSGCGDEPAEPGAAAVAGDTRVSVAELQDAYTELNDVAKGAGGEPIPQTSLLSWLLLAPISIPAAAEAGAAVSDDEAKALLDQLHAQMVAAEAAAAATASPSPSPSPSEGSAAPTASATPSPTVVPGTYSASTVTAVRSYLSMQNVIQQLGQADAIREWMGQVYDELDATDPQISPRYGAYARPDLEAATSVEQLLTVVGTPTPNWFAAATTPSPAVVPEGDPAAPPGEAPAEAPGDATPTTTP